MSLDQFIRLADSIVEFDSDFNDNRYPISSVHSIEVHKYELKTTWSRIKAAYEKFLFDRDSEGDNEDEEPTSLETLKVKYKSTYITYCNCLAKLSELAEQLRFDSISKSDSPTVPSSSKEHSIRITDQSHSFHLPPCDIEVFQGDYASWPTFRDMFAAMYIKNTRLSPVEKLFHLSQKTKGEAQEIVRKSPLTNQGFDIAWTNLCDRFENRRILVNGQLKILLNLEAITSESGNAIKKLQRDINSCISTLQLYAIDTESWDPIFVFLCSNKLPSTTLILWEQGLNDKSAIPKWSDLDLFLTNRYRTLESVSDIRNSTSFKVTDSKPKTSNNNTKKVNIFQNNISSPKCQLCPRDSHPIRKCPRFLKMDYSQRFNEIRKQGLCLNCFSKSHTVRNCNSKNNCYRCNKRHNTLLHKDSENSVSTANPGTNYTSRLSPHSAPFENNPKPTIIQSTSSAGANVIQSCFATGAQGVLLGTVIVEVCHLGVRYKARALIDSGSEGSFISEKLFNLLKLPYKRVNASVSGLNNTVSANVRKETSLILGSPINSNTSLSVTALVVPHLSGRLPSRTFDSSAFINIPNIQLADPQFFNSGKIDILIGGDLFPSVMLSGIRHNICGSLMAQETIFGWILTGPISTNSSTSSSTCVSYFCEVSLDKEISRFWEVENLPRKNFASSSDIFCEDLFIKTTKRDEEGKYIVSLPFKEGFPERHSLGQSRTNAMAQFFRNEARLLRIPDFKEKYDSVVQEYETLDHMSKVPAPFSSDHVRHYYLPHHAVLKPDSTTTKLRVVFNASAPSSNGLSLNDILHAGPILQQDLTVLILKWRFFRYVFNADIEKMYRQIRVNPDHTAFQRILFRTDPFQNVQDFELKTVTFGVNCAPYLAIRTLRQLAADVQSIYPKASQIIRDLMYVDDVLAGAHTAIEALESRNELILALKSAGFLLRKWTANSMDILDNIPSEHRLFEDFLDLDDKSTAKTLGIRWNAKTDTFYFIAKPLPDTVKCTKREVLSQIARLFDPAGWLSPCVVVAKILMQRIWVDGTGWDEVLTSETLSQWMEFQSKYSAINDIQIPRWVNYSPDAEIQFHGFSDASEKAYAAALYIRVVKGDTVSCFLVSSKTRVAPVKSLSIPRLELCGALLLAEMIDTLIPKFDIEKYSIFCWTDSTIVLSWLAKPPCSWLTFVANRVSKIIEVTDPSRWFHVSSECNPADVASRGVYPSELIDNNLWWHGPNWLLHSKQKWPNQHLIQETDEEIKIRAHFSYFQNHEDILARFSSFPRAMRVIAYIYRLFFRTHPKYRSSFYKNSIIISNSEIVFVRSRLISMYQKIHYCTEYRTLSSSKNLSSTSSLLSLNPFVDPEGIIRSCGRLESSPELGYDEKHPIILPYNCHYTRLLVKFIHEITLHGGNQLVLRLIRTRYWIPKVKNLIKATINKCKPCIIYKRKCQKQLMGNLPPERLIISRPFTNTGLDFAGPFEIKSYSGRACRITKGYVCVFICFSTKAIHLEATTDLTTSAFLAAFSRFVSRRGCPLHLHSDNGKTFVGASKILSREFIQTSHQAIVANYGLQNITWHFIPPGAPHMGGLWEAGVKSFKTHFRKVAGGFKFTFEEFSTLLSRIEACLNSRPLSPISQDPSDFSALTPGHFLIGTPLLAPIDPKINDTSISMINRWQRIKLIHRHFCDRWKSEYLKELQKRTKWQKPEDNLCENTLVVIMDENLPPNSWRLGRVEKVYSGSDNRVRVADVFTQRGTIRRPIKKLIALSSN